MASVIALMILESLKNVQVRIMVKMLSVHFLLEVREYPTLPFFSKFIFFFPLQKIMQLDVAAHRGLKKGRWDVNTMERRELT